MTIQEAAINEQNKQLELQQVLISKQEDYIKKAEKNTLYYQATIVLLSVIAIGLAVEK